MHRHGHRLRDQKGDAHVSIGNMDRLGVVSPTPESVLTAAGLTVARHAQSEDDLQTFMQMLGLNAYVLEEAGPVLLPHDRLRICKRGHDTFVCGRTSDGSCRDCRRMSNREYARRKRGAA